MRLGIPGQDDKQYQCWSLKNCNTQPIWRTRLKGFLFMNKPVLIKQVELFGEDSAFSLENVTRQRINERAHEVATAEKPQWSTVKDYTGQRFGKLVVERMTDERHHAGVVFLCRCDCGNLVKMTSRHLTRKAGPTTHCGCMEVGRGNRPRPGKGGLTNAVRVANNNPMISFRALQSNYRFGASSRGYKWELTEQQFFDLVTGNCQYCGAEPKQVFIRKPHEFIYNGVDRVDSDLDYSPPNCVSCCGQCNVAKKEHSLADFLEWAERVHEHQAKIRACR